MRKTLEYACVFALIIGWAAAMADIEPLAFFSLFMCVILGLASMAVPEKRWPQA